MRIVCDIVFDEQFSMSHPAAGVISEMELVVPDYPHGFMSEARLQKSTVITYNEY